MSMICWMNGLSPAQIAAMRADPSLVDDFTFIAENDFRRTEFEAAYAKMTPEEKKERAQQYQNALDGEKEMVDPLRPRFAPYGACEPLLPLFGDWNVMHYVFTGDENLDRPHPPGDFLLTGEEIGEDAGYGPPRIQDPDATAVIARYLASLTWDDLKPRADINEMSRLEVYPLSWGHGDVDPETTQQWLEAIPRNLQKLQDYTARMAAKGYGLLLWLN